MSKHDLPARPIYHHKRESIEAHLTIVFAALAVGRLVEERTGWSTPSESICSRLRDSPVARRAASCPRYGCR